MAAHGVGGAVKLPGYAEDAAVFGEALADQDPQPQAGVVVNDVPDVLVHKSEGVQFTGENVSDVHLSGPGFEKTEGSR